MRNCVFVLGLLALCGCASPERLAAADDARCTSYGFRPGTDAYANCRMQADMQRQAQRQAAVSSLSNIQIRPPGVSPSINCVSRPGLSGSVETVCQ